MNQHHDTTRRTWLKQAACQSLGIAGLFHNSLPNLQAYSQSTKNSKDRPTLLLRSGWQTVNIGDIGHSPGILKLLEVYAPEFQIILWPNSVDRGVEPMLQKRFPDLKIVKGRLRRDGKLDSPDIEQAFQQADFFLHGSGPSVVSRRELAFWNKSTRKPYGIYGVTVSKINPELHEPALRSRFYLHTGNPFPEKSLRR